MQARPFLKWVGGKGRLVPALLPHIHLQSDRVYYEPFLGAGALFFALQPKRAVLSDVNAQLITTWRHVRDNIDEVIRLLRDFYTPNHSEEFYYETRERFNAAVVQTPGDVLIATSTIYLNKTGFNGLFRVNSSGGFNVPFGRYDNPTICDEDNLRACSVALQGVKIERQDFRALFGEPQTGDTLFADPPYVPLTTTSNFVGYSADGFDENDQLILRDWARALKHRGVNVVLSNSSAARAIYEAEAPPSAVSHVRFRIEEVMVKRSGNSDPTKRGAVKELIIT